MGQSASITRTSVTRTSVTDTHIHDTHVRDTHVRDTHVHERDVRDRVALRQVVLIKPKAQMEPVQAQDVLWSGACGLQRALTGTAVSLNERGPVFTLSQRDGEIVTSREVSGYTDPDRNRAEASSGNRYICSIKSLQRH
uniref:Uncharacterized protein n=1 Tax=Knipowitschia caucasica TaxID=637954 RepID=A0AAV2JZL4_KNICA